MRGSITFASVLIGVVAASACSDEDEKKDAKGNPDAGADGSVAGDGGSAGSSAGGTGAAGGLGGASGMGGTGATGGMDASAGTGGTTGGTGGTSGGTGGTSGGTGGTSGGTGGTGGLAPLICNPGGAAGQSSGGAGAVGGVGGSTASGGTGGAAGNSGTAGLGGAAGASGAGAGGAAGGGGTPQWRDWDAYQCRNCPSPALSDCTDFESGNSTFDVGTRLWTIQVKPGTVEVVTATFRFYWEYLDSQGEWQSGTTTGSFVVDKDTLTADLSALIPPEVMGFANPQITVTDACGTETMLYYGYFQELDPDAGSVISIHCEGGF